MSRGLSFTLGWSNCAAKRLPDRPERTVRGKRANAQHARKAAAVCRGTAAVDLHQKCDMLCRTNAGRVALYVFNFLYNLKVKALLAPFQL